jgi:hypothetical protein
MRTTIDIYDPILKDLKHLQKRGGKSLDRMVSDLLAEALAAYKSPAHSKRFGWPSRPMRARVDLLFDKHALLGALGRSDR